MKFWLGSAFICLSVLGADAPAANGAGQPAAAALIHDLASDNFLIRSKAKDELFRMGRAAIEPLEAAAGSSDAEVRARAVEILIALRGRGFLGIAFQQSAFGQGLWFEGGLDDEPLPPLRADRVHGLWKDGTVASFGVRGAFPAELAGIQEGDLVYSINGKRVYTLTDVIREVGIVGPGRIALVVVERNGKRKRIPVTLTRNLSIYLSDPQDPVTHRKIQMPDPPPPVDLEHESAGPERADASPKANPHQPIMLQELNPEEQAAVIKKIEEIRLRIRRGEPIDEQVLKK